MLSRPLVRINFRVRRQLLAQMMTRRSTRCIKGSERPHLTRKRKKKDAICGEKSTRIANAVELMSCWLLNDHAPLFGRQLQQKIAGKMGEDGHHSEIQNWLSGDASCAPPSRKRGGIRISTCRPVLISARPEASQSAFHFNPNHPSPEILLLARQQATQ